MYVPCVSGILMLNVMIHIKEYIVGTWHFAGNIQLLQLLREREGGGGGSYTFQDYRSVGQLLWIFEMLYIFVFIDFV
jgi:hypothetical protein